MSQEYQPAWEDTEIYVGEINSAQGSFDLTRSLLREAVDWSLGHTIVSPPKTFNINIPGCKTVIYQDGIDAVRNRQAKLEHRYAKYWTRLESYYDYYQTEIECTYSGDAQFDHTYGEWATFGREAESAITATVLTDASTPAPSFSDCADCEDRTLGPPPSDPPPSN